MRIYCFGNFYLSSIQQGIQALHVLGEMVAKYGIKRVAQDAGYNESVFSGSTPQSTILADYIANHKTAILLNGGAQKELENLYGFFSSGFISEKNEFPYTFFGEEKAALNNALTCVGIVLPFRIYELADRLKKDTDKLIQFRIEEQLNRKGFAHYDYENPECVINNRWEYDLAQLITTYRLAS